MIRDAIYDLVARNRYRWFSRRDACILPNSDRSWPSWAAPKLQDDGAGAGRHDEGSSVTEIQLSVPDAGEQLKALRHDDHPNVGNLIGYSYRKPGDYKFSQVWYERGLKVDPNHVLTWQYYGLCQIEQGNRDQTHEIAERLASLPGHSFSFERCTVGFRNPYRPCRHPQACRRLRSSSALRPPWLRW